jgi:hypothetical protein
MNGVVFETRPPIVASAPTRADIACFVGFVSRRKPARVRPDGRYDWTDLPPAVSEWLRHHGWLWMTETHSTPPVYHRASAANLLDVPVPIDAWSDFDALFAWERRPLQPSAASASPGRSATEPDFATTYLGAAVRSFFAQGGRRCYVVRAGDPEPVDPLLLERMEPAERARAMRERQTAQLAKIIPGFPYSFACDAADRRSWRGIGHLFGLPDASFLCLPDLPEIFAMDVPRLEDRQEPGPEEHFAECSEAATQQEPPPRMLKTFGSPRSGDAEYARWGAAVRMVGDVLARRQDQREVQFVAAVPLPAAGAEGESNLLTILPWPGRTNERGVRDDRRDAAAFVQLVYPWTVTPGSARLPGNVEPADGVLAGVLARNALTRGTFRTGAGLSLGDVYDLVPIVRTDQLTKTDRRDTADRWEGYTLPQRVSVLGPTPHGLEVMSDVTSSTSPTYRPGSVNRLVSLIARAARELGEESIFEPSGERLWAEVRRRMNAFLTGLLQRGALRGAAPAEAFNVRCDRSVMTQADLDAGRVLAEVRFAPAATVERITVVFAAQTGATPMAQART